MGMKFIYATKPMNINKVKQTLEILSKTYNRTNKDYENIIERLKKLE